MDAHDQLNKAPRPERRPARPRRRSPVGLLFTIISWPVAIGLVVLCLAWTVAGAAWEIDLAANLTAQTLVVAAACTVIWLLSRRWRLAITGLLACGLGLAPLLIGRAAILPRPMELGRDAEPASAAVDAAGIVRLLHYNASARGEGEGIEQFMADSRADVMSIVCPPIAQQIGVVSGRRLKGIYAGKLVRQWQPEINGNDTMVTAAFLVSHWPMREVDTDWLGDAAAYIIAGIVERPTGEFAVIAVHPRSPRTAERWRMGNQVVHAVGRLATRLAEQGQPVVVLTDLNSTPSGYRSHHLFWGARLSRAKPLLERAGTYPDEVPLGLSVHAKRVLPARWPLSVAIDDALISPEIEVTGWRLGPKLPSEHRPILVELRIPAGRGSTAAEAGR